MSIIATLFGWSKLPQWALELAVIAAVAGGLLWYHHHVYETGITAQQTADKVASAKVEAQAAAATQAAQDAANRAEESYHAEVTHDAALAAATPLPAIRLCDDTDNSGARVPEAGTTLSGAQGTSPAARGVQQVSAGNSGVRAEQHPDISGLLSLLAQRGDDGSAVIREFQQRQSP